MESAEIPRHNVVYSSFDPKASWLTVMCRASRFQITISPKDLRGSRFELEYSQLVAKVNGVDDESGDDESAGDYYETLCDWILEPCFPRFLEYTPHCPTDLTLQAFYYPPTYHLKLVVSESSLYAKPVRDRHITNPYSLMIPSQDLSAKFRMQEFFGTPCKVGAAGYSYHRTTA